MFDLKILAGLALLAAAAMPLPASAMAVSRPSFSTSPSDIVEVRDHHDCDHKHVASGGHRRNRGNDRFYDDNSDSGVLFKSFVTGTLFNRDADASAEELHPPVHRP